MKIFVEVLILFILTGLVAGPVNAMAFPLDLYPQLDGFDRNSVIMDDTGSKVMAFFPNGEMAVFFRDLKEGQKFGEVAP